MSDEARLRRVFVAYDAQGSPHFGGSRRAADAAAAKAPGSRKVRGEPKRNPRSRRRKSADLGLDMDGSVR